MDLGTQKVGEVSAVAGEEELDGSLDILIPRFTGYLDIWMTQWQNHWIPGCWHIRNLDIWLAGIWLSDQPLLRSQGRGQNFRTNTWRK